MKKMEKYRNPAATADIIVPKAIGSDLGESCEILLIKRKNGPYKDMWAIPGGYLEYGKETLEETAARELKEETSLIVKIDDLALLGVYSNPQRDPRGHVISHVYVAKRYEGEPRANDDALEYAWFPVSNLPKLAFDHEKIINDYIRKYLCEKR